MFSWLWRKKEPYVETEILNDGLNKAMAFGANWLKPIQDRLSKNYPALSEEQLNKYDEICRDAMNAGHRIVYEYRQEHDRDISFDEFQREFCEVYPWVNRKNLKYAFNQGCYYAHKDFGPTGT